MLRFILNRTLQAAFVVLAIAFMAFVVSNYVGDPVSNVLGPDATADDHANLRKELGLDDPVLVRFAHYLGAISQGDFGRSYRTAEPVLTMIGERLPATLELAVITAIFTLCVGLPLGVLCGLAPNHIAARIVMSLTLVFVSLPTFLVGILLILLFSVWLGVLPSFGRAQVADPNVWSVFRSAILPAATLGLFPMTLIMRLVRAEMVVVLRSDFIRFAIARGLPRWRVYFVHALKNSLMPVITMMGLQFGTIVVFSVVTETVFAWPGVGRLLLESVQFADVPVICTYLVLTGTLFVAINLLTDLLYLAVDPRLRTGHGQRK